MRARTALAALWLLLIAFALTPSIARAETTVGCAGGSTYGYDSAVAPVLADCDGAVTSRSSVAAPSPAAVIIAGPSAGQVDSDDGPLLSTALDLSAPRGAPGTALRPVGTHLESVDDVFANPQLLIDDVADPSRVRTILEGTPGWESGALRHGSSAGEGWTFRELNAAGTDFTDRYIQWSPGSSHHPNPYWKVSSGQTGTTRIGPDFGNGG